MNCYICKRRNLSHRSENFTISQLSPKLQDFIYLGLSVSQFSDRLKKVDIWVVSFSRWFPSFSKILKKCIRSHKCAKFQRNRATNFHVGRISHFFRLRKILFQNHMNWKCCIGNYFPRNQQIFHILHYLDNSEILFFRAYNWAKFQQKLFSQKMASKMLDFEQTFSIPKLESDFSNIQKNTR